MKISVIICTHNPDRERLRRTLLALDEQTLDRGEWELIMVDNASTDSLNWTQSVAPSLTINIVREERPGLTFARCCGVRATRAPIVVFVDDDNVLAKDYLQVALSLMIETPTIGLAGGVIEPEWESAAPEVWAQEFFDLLALRNFGEADLVSPSDADQSYPTFAPVGAGMVARRAALMEWAQSVLGGNTPSDRIGRSLASAGDCDIVIRAIRNSWTVAYCPKLRMKHIIPPARLTVEYLGRLNYGVMKSWIELLQAHGLSPWPRVAAISIPLRKAKAYVTYAAWRGSSAYVRWRGACGHFDARAKKVSET